MQDIKRKAFTQRQLCFLEKKLIEVGWRNIKQALVPLKMSGGYVDSVGLGLPTKIILSGLLRCPCLMNNHIIRLLSVSKGRMRRVAWQYYNRCNRRQTLVSQMLKAVGPPHGTVVAWYLTTQGYKAAMQINYPKEEPPTKAPAINLDEVIHNMLIANIFCDIFAIDTQEKTFETLSKINWYPLHKTKIKIHSHQEESYLYPSRFYNRNEYLIPDAIIETANEKLRIYLEVDRSTKSLTIEKEKLRRYIKHFYRNPYLQAKNTLIFYSVDELSRGQQIVSLRNDLEDEFYLPTIKYFIHEETGEGLRRLLYT